MRNASLRKDAQKFVIKRSNSGSFNSPKPVQPLTVIGKLHEAHTPNRKLLHSMEKGISAMKKIFPITPGRSQLMKRVDKPKVVAVLTNVSHLSFRSDAWLFKQILDKVEARSYINYRQKKYTIRCQIMSDKLTVPVSNKSTKNLVGKDAKVNSKAEIEIQQKVVTLDFEIEVVRLAATVIDKARQLQLMKDKAHTNVSYDEDIIEFFLRKYFSGLRPSVWNTSS